MPRGLFITFEGGEGSGKSTQVKYLQESLQRLKVSVTVVREPGGTQLGDLVRNLLKYQLNLTPEAELLLFNASRAQLVSQVIRPALERGDVVLCDRFTDSTVAYQGYGRGISLDKVESVNKVATDDLKPDLTIFLDIPPAEGLRRRLGGRDLFEKESSFGSEAEATSLISFHLRVRQGYLSMARKEPERWLMVGALQSREEVAHMIWQRVEPMVRNLIT